MDQAGINRRYHKPYVEYKMEETLKLLKKGGNYTIMDYKYNTGVETRLAHLGLLLPEPLIIPAGVKLPFAMVRVHGNRAFVSGHGPQNPDGSLAGPFGKVGSEVTI